MKIYFASRLSGSHKDIEVRSMFVGELRSQGYWVYSPKEAGLISDEDAEGPYSRSFVGVPKIPGSKEEWSVSGMVPYKMSWAECWNKDIMAIQSCDVVLVYVDKDGEVGSGVAFEIGYGYALHKPLVGYAPEGSKIKTTIYRHLVRWYTNPEKLLRELRLFPVDENLFKYSIGGVKDE